MATTDDALDFATLCDEQNYDIDSLETEIRAEQHAKQLLKKFHRWLLEKEQRDALNAGQLAAGADYFLCEFLIGARRQNIFITGAEQIRQFGGNWYIIRNLEPNLKELQPMLEGTALFFRFCAELKTFSTDEAERIATTVSDTTYFAERIETFHRLEDDAYKGWDRDCPLK